MKDFFLKPLQGVAMGLAFMLGAHALVIFLIRPISNWIGNLEWPNLKALTIGGIIILIILRIIFAVLKAVLEEAWGEIESALSKYFMQYVCLAFFHVGKGFHSIYRVLGIYPGLIVIFPVILGVCCFSTFMDYLAIQASLDVSINMFSDRIVEDMEEVVSVQSMIGWIAQDQVSVSNFWQYWFYSLRATILGIRFEGWTQWLAFLVNVAASILFLNFGINQAVYGLFGFEPKWENDQLVYYLPSGVVQPKPARPFGFLVSGIIAVLLLIGQFALSALPVNRIRQMIVTSIPTRTSTPTPPSQPPLTPQQTVAKYYELATSNREAALDLISERWKKAEKKNKEEGLKFWNTIDEVKIYGTETLEQSPNRVVVKVWLQYYMKYEDYTPCETRTFELKLDRSQNKWILYLPRDVVQKPYCDR